MRCGLCIWHPLGFPLRAGRRLAVGGLVAGLNITSPVPNSQNPFTPQNLPNRFSRELFGPPIPTPNRNRVPRPLRSPKTTTIFQYSDHINKGKTRACLTTDSTWVAIKLHELVLGLVLCNKQCFPLKETNFPFDFSMDSFQYVVSTCQREILQMSVLVPSRRSQRIKQRIKPDPNPKQLAGWGGGVADLAVLGTLHRSEKLE